MAAVSIEKRKEPFARVRRERDDAWDRLEEEYPRVKAEHPDKLVAFGKDGFIAANDDLFALVAEYKEGVHGRAGSHKVHARFHHFLVGRTRVIFGCADAHSVPAWAGHSESSQDGLRARRKAA